MPKAPGCLVGDREMRGRSGSHNAEGIGASAESGRGDDRGLTLHQVMERRAEARSQRASKPRRPPAVTSHRVGCLSTNGGSRRRCRTARVTPRKGPRETGTIEGGGARRGAHRPQINESRGREGGSDERGRASWRRHEARTEVEGCSDRCTKKQHSELCGGGRHPPTQTANSELFRLKLP